MDSIAGFISAPIKLAALIDNKTKARKGNSLAVPFAVVGGECQAAKRMTKTQVNNSKMQQDAVNGNSCNLHHRLLPSSSPSSLLLLLLLTALASWPAMSEAASGGNNLDGGNLRHQTHYLNIVPSTHFNYHEGRQFSQSEAETHDQLHLLNQQQHHQQLPSARSMDAPASNEAHDQAMDSMEAKRASQVDNGNQQQQPMSNSHIYKRSSALISSSILPAQRVSGYYGNYAPQHNNPSLRRRMMSEINTSNSIINSRWSASPSSQAAGGGDLALESGESREPADEPLVSSGSNLAPKLARPEAQPAKLTQEQQQSQDEQDLVLLRQKQHIQYHDQFVASTSTITGKCHKRTLNFCASVLPFNTTTFPNIIGDTNRFEVKRSLPFFGFLAKSSCNKRLDELLCLLLEPPCSVQSGNAIPPCKKFCRLALEGCNEYIPATLALSSVFDCRQYPDSSDPNVCINLAQGSKCAADEFKCPDKTCIPRNWLCDGVRDCVFAADEANCTAPTGAGQTELPSVCSTEEFKCDGKCVPKAWKCDGERDCLDGTDESECDLRPRCGPDRFKCADGNGCIPKRWVCDGKAECRDGSDEMSCEQRDCSDTDFKCDNGICIPKIWRCDRQYDCKDGSDERFCVYPTPSTTTTSTTTTSTSATSAAAATVTESVAQQNSSYFSHQHSQPEVEELVTVVPEVVTSQSARQQQQEESRIVADISRIIQMESSSSSLAPVVTTTLSEIPTVASSPAPQESQQQQQQQQMVTTVAQPQQVRYQHQQKDLKKYDYDLMLPQQNQIASEMASGQQQQHQQQQQQVIDFVQHQPHHLQPQVKGHGPRVPIYRSLFKTLKGGDRIRGAGNGSGSGSAQRHVVAVARRRRADRVQQQQEQLERSQWVDQQQQQVNNQTAPIGHHQLRRHQAEGQQQQQVASPTAHGVASYLQLLNGRYNNYRNNNNNNNNQQVQSAPSVGFNANQLRH